MKIMGSVVYTAMDLCCTLNISFYLNVLEISFEKTHGMLKRMGSKILLFMHIVCLQQCIDILCFMTDSYVTCN